MMYSLAPSPRGPLLILLEVDALATAQALTDDAARSPLMQYVHRFLLSLPSYAKHHQRLLCAHIFGEANVAADDASRGEFDTLHALFSQLGLAPLRVEPPTWVPRVLSALLSLQRGEDVPLPTCHTTASTAIGVFNPSMAGSPFAHDKPLWELSSPPLFAPLPPTSLASPIAPSALSAPPLPSHNISSPLPPPSPPNPPAASPPPLVPDLTPTRLPPPRCRKLFIVSSKAIPLLLLSVPPLSISAL